VFTSNAPDRWLAGDCYAGGAVAWSEDAEVVRPRDSRADDSSRSQRGSFQDFYQANYRGTVAIVAALLGDRAEAEDVAQEAFARALARWHRVSAFDVPESWVRRVAMHLAIDSARRLRRAAALRARVAASPVPPVSDPLDPLPSTRLMAALLRVPLGQREVLVLHYLADMPVAVIAPDRGLSTGTVKSRLASGRRRLEAELSRPAEASDAR
jgi:RNA polymerase sigma-70 factor, ECF subfamily